MALISPLIGMSATFFFLRGNQWVFSIARLVFGQAYFLLKSNSFAFSSTFWLLWMSLAFYKRIWAGNDKDLASIGLFKHVYKSFWWQVNSCKLHFERLFVFVLSSGWMCLYEWQENYFKICLWGYCMFLKIPSQYLSSLLLLPNVIWQNKNQLKLIFPKLWLHV